ncbi:hypothetical protein HQN60_11055 [Deefgea piscis]|uniref:AI-2E family transporter n=1 Tax=Deefgea piscis TaxID=2739061 RepID=A0A6M8SUI4_9NEIS|nr:hypothetical protein [Deefgea piscis]QKJ67196.1 hypothetical protein HQN60_11055 [Deefgea piscis]
MSLFRVKPSPTTPTQWPHPRSGVNLASLGIVASLLLLVFFLHLVPALLAGMLVFLLIQSLTRLTFSMLSKVWSRWLVLVLMSSWVVLALFVLVLAILSIMKSEHGLLALLDEMAQIIGEAKGVLPLWLSYDWPSSPTGIQAAVVSLLQHHIAQLQATGKELGLLLAHLIVGAVIGGIVALSEVNRCDRLGVLSQALLIRVQGFTAAFRAVMLAQLKISLINTALASVYLLLILPAVGAHLPFVKTMLVLTFILGLLPIVGNLFSNAIIVTVSFSQSLSIAIASLVFLVLIHKSEYFLNAQIIGTQIRAKAWELLLAMLLMEAMFGVAGLVMAAVLYAYLKIELRLHKLL